MKKFVIKDPIFRFGFLVVIGGTFKQAVHSLEHHVKAKAPKELLEHRTEAVATFGTWGDRKDCLLHFHANAFTIEVIAHEVFHAVAYVTSHLEITLNSETEEVYAYYTEFLMREMKEHL